METEVYSSIMAGRVQVLDLALLLNYYLALFIL
jgi:hypothetical protein